MIQHSPSTLEGPLTHAQPWWLDDSQVSATRPELATGVEPRLDLIDRLRREIADGSYETPEKWNVALNRMLDRLEDA